MATSRKGTTSTTSTSKKPVKKATSSRKTVKKTTSVKKVEKKDDFPHVLTPAEQLCSNVREDIKPQVVTLANAVLAIQAKIEKEIPKYGRMKLAQRVKVGTGEKIIRANPEIQEFRATVRDYATSLNSLQMILTENKAPTQVSDMDSLMKKFKIAK
jgi:hypothetical protein